MLLKRQLLNTVAQRVVKRQTPLIHRSFSKFATDFGTEQRDVVSRLEGRHLKRIDDYSPDELKAMLSFSRYLKQCHKNGALDTLLAQKSMSMIFQKRSTRTRVSSETGMALLGGHSLFLSTDDIQLGVNESIKDSAIVLSRFNSLILARVFEHSIIEELCTYSDVPVINALSDMHHPLQILADLMTLQEHLGADLSGKTLTWVGDGNNVLHDLMLGCPLVGMHIKIATPKGYEPDKRIIAETKSICQRQGVSLTMTNDPVEAVHDCDVVVTDTWVSMGQEEETKKRLKAFDGYEITHELMEQGGAKSDWKFLHCLPRHPEEVSDEVFYDEERSLVFDEAENRMYTVMAVMASMLGAAR